jgi:hypothetical protein
MKNQSSLPPSLITELLECLEGYVQEDDTIRGDSTERNGRTWDEENAYWIKGQDRAIAAISQARSFLEQSENRPVWTEGICGDGAAILKDGVMQPIEDVIAALNAAEVSHPKVVEPTDDEAEAWADSAGFVKGYAEHPCGFWASTDDIGRLIWAAFNRWGCLAIQPEPYRPNDTQIDALVYDCIEGGSYDVRVVVREALSRWGCPIPQPEPVEPVTHPKDEALLNEADAYFLYGEGKYTASPEEVIAFARHMLAACPWSPHKSERPTPKPIPVSERLPEEEDCNAYEYCWFWSNPVKSWDFRSRNLRRVHDTHWLPHWAMPLPNSEGDVL